VTLNELDQGFVKASKFGFTPHPSFAGNNRFENEQGWKHPDYGVWLILIVISQKHLHTSSSVNTNDLSIDPFAVLAGKEAYNSCNIDRESNSVQRTPCFSILGERLAGAESE